MSNEKEYIEMSIDDWYNENIGFEFDMVSYRYDLTSDKDEEKIKQLMELLPNTIWTQITLDNGCIAYVNRLDESGDEVLFSHIAYSSDNEFCIIDEESCPCFD
jgi:hypothetical protein